MDRFSFIFRFSALAGLVIGIVSCLPRGSDEASWYVPAPEIALLDRVDFAALSSSVLVPYCTKCHADMKSESGLRAYVVAGDRGGSSLYTSVANGSMPPSGTALSASALETIGRYVDGLIVSPIPEPSPTPTDSPSPSVADFATLKARILEPKCLMCHEDMGTETGLATYVNPGKPAESSLYLRTEDLTMPPSEPLSESERAFVRAYVERKGEL